LTPSARSGNLIAGDGTKNGLPAPNKKLQHNPKQPLDRKSPIQVWVRTVEEIDEFVRSKKPAMLYFSRCPVDPTKINQEAACPAKP
jgi:hypothetical protein